MRFLFRGLIAGFLALACIAPAFAAEPLTVFAAASLKESLDEAAHAYELKTGQAVRVSYAASSALARQIEQGAPADVFVSADVEWMDYLAKAKAIDLATRRNLLGNTLVLVAPADAKTGAIALQPGVDLAKALGNGRLAVALVDSVPAGKYAKQSLIALGAWDAVKSRTAEAENVRAALLLVARGEVPLGIVYGSDAKAEPRVKIVGTFPDSSHAPIVYPVARVAASSHPSARAFVQWLQTKDARAIFLRHGFRSP
ncbi:Molybdenum ABC transporter, periplasmic molybdenum-binding protein ModA [Lysobacter dokdonensis DS-58]|uniref:Molybdenum ABC transporter, periplasmic molybdenum-binding protein ModA n=1 Tax=Lysobacter dokdonensis DS-58 TaxID=1300345 RepID=A0A0A2WI98_9GAMM|nr:molybdate ABC transporter substrate-binding protein [Lysobacter dokdonensis]KGQ18437.1 Molybdenum ABC transporter, periplasmic molybdenum-binding protein ModA [Lysobacter dokdonensis DS-58]